MKFKIENTWNLIDPDGLPYRRFKIRNGFNLFYLNEIDFKDNLELLKVKKDHLVLIDLDKIVYKRNEITVKDKTITILYPVQSTEKFDNSLTDLNNIPLLNLKNGNYKATINFVTGLELIFVFNKAGEKISFVKNLSNDQSERITIQAKTVTNLFQKYFKSEEGITFNALKEFAPNIKQANLVSYEQLLEDFPRDTGGSLGLDEGEGNKVAENKGLRKRPKLNLSKLKGLNLRPLTLHSLDDFVNSTYELRLKFSDKSEESVLFTVLDDEIIFPDDLSERQNKAIEKIFGTVYTEQGKPVLLISKLNAKMQGFSFSVHTAKSKPNDSENPDSIITNVNKKTIFQIALKEPEADPSDFEGEDDREKNSSFLRQLKNSYTSSNKETTSSFKKQVQEAYLKKEKESKTEESKFIPRHNKRAKMKDELSVIKSQPDESHDSKNISFIQNMLKLAVKEKVDSHTKDRLLSMIDGELRNKTSMELKILDEIILLKDLLTKKPEEEPPTPKQKFAHSPKNTVNFLRLFTYEDGSGFKELVHDTDLDVFTPDLILNKVTNYPNFIAKFHNKKVVNLDPIHAFVQASTVDLITKFKTEGLLYIENFKKHPFEADKVYTDYAKKFKKNIRFGSGREYTNLHSTLIELIKNQKFKNSFNPDQVLFLPDERKFDIRSNFYTWVPSILNGVKYILDGIKDHGNISGDFDYSSNQKQIEIECWKETDPERHVILSIYDKLTVSASPHQNAFEKLLASTARNKFFWSLCDWKVEADFEDGSYCFQLLGEESEDNVKIVNLDKPVGGFKHILKFYDPKAS